MSKKTISILSFLLIFCFCLQAKHTVNHPLPTASQLKWGEAEIGVVFHYDLHVFDGKKYTQGGNRISPIADYNVFAPKYLNTDQWVRSAKAAGAKFAVFTVTHETGFALYQSDANPYCLKALRWRDGKGDVFKEFVTSCRKYGVLPGVYVGIRWNSFLGIHNFKAEGDGEFAKRRQLWYKKMCEKMVKELCTNYGDLFLIWFDGGADDPRGLGPDVLPIVSKYQPNCLFYHNVDRADFRWGGSESGKMNYPCWSSFTYPFSHSNKTDLKNHLQLLKTGDPDGNYWLPAMADFPLRCMNGRHEWFWEPGDEKAVCSLERMLDIYDHSVGRNATLMIGLTPNPDGLMPKGDSLRLAEFGAAITARYGAPIMTTGGVGLKYNLKWKKEKRVNCIILQEEIKSGERVRAYVVEAKVNGKWQQVAKGSAVGQKRIQHFTPVQTRKLRLKITKAIAKPLIKTFAAYSVTADSKTALVKK